MYVLQALKLNGGVVMVTFYLEYTRCDDPDNSTLSDVANHVQYIGALIGYQHVAISSNFDGMARGPRHLEDVG